MDKNKTALIIYNPCAGKNSSRPEIEKLIRALEFEQYNITVVYTEYSGHATDIAEERGGEFDYVICCGGDGTLSETIGGMMKGSHKTPIGYIPMGSTNDLADTIGIPSNLHGAAHAINKNHTNSYDVGAFNDRYFTYIASFGPGTAVSYSTPQKMKNLMGYSAYMLNAFVLRVIPILSQVKPKHIRIEYDGNVIEDDFYFGAVSNALSVAGMIHYDSDEVKLNDGMFEVILVRKLKHSTDAFKMLHKIKKRDYDGETLLYFKASEVRFIFSKPEKWTLDGEYGGEPAEVNIKVLKHAVDIASPKKKIFE